MITTAAGIGIAPAFLVRRLGAPPLAETSLLAAATLAGGWYVVPRGLRAAEALALDVNFLMSIAAMSAWLIGQTGEAAATPSSSRSPRAAAIDAAQGAAPSSRTLGDFEPQGAGGER